jgi:CheY-like chemotaxis protein/signal transduction histidine kinase
MGLLKNIANYFDQKVDRNLDFENSGKTITISFTSIIAIVFYLFFGIISLINESYMLALVLGIASALNYLIYYYLHKTLKINPCINALLIVTGAVFLYCLITGGAFGTGYLWIFPYPILAISLKGLEKGARISIIFLVFIIAVCIINLYVPGLPDYKLSLSLRLIGSYLSIHSIIYVFEYLRVINYHKMKLWINDSLSENKRKDDFLSKLSHQIRTPLNNITLIYNLVDRSKLPEDQQDLFDTIIASTNNLVNVVNNIVQVSAIDIDENNQNPVSFNIVTTIQNTLKLFINQNKERLEIDFNAKAIKPNYIGNPVRIKQLFLNIIENIVKIGSEEKLKLTITINSENIDSTLTNLSIDIICPPMSMKKDMNDNYYVASSQPILNKNDITKNYLDFNITRKIVQLYRGTFNINTNNQSTTLKLTLILKIDEKETIEYKSSYDESEEQLIQPARNQQLEDANVLLVEDNSINQKIVILSLKNKVKSIDVANNGKEALDKFGITKYDIILMDIQMPVMNGIIATKKIRELELSTNMQTPIIAITANALSGDKEACLAAGMNEYISKPFQVEVLLQKMRNLLSTSTTN